MVVVIIYCFIGYKNKSLHGINRHVELPNITKQKTTLL